MAWGALLLAIASFFCIGLGVLFTPVPGVGAVFAFGAPVLALAGIILGGRAVTKSKAVASAGGGAAAVPAPGETSGLALAAVIASALAFVPAVITALTCGACNALCATGNVQTHSFGTGVDPFDMMRRRAQPQAGAPSDDDLGITVPTTAADGGAPDSPSALPPPPLAPGPPP